MVPAVASPQGPFSQSTYMFLHMRLPYPECAGLRSGTISALYSRGLMGPRVRVAWNCPAMVIPACCMPQLHATQLQHRSMHHCVTSAPAYRAVHGSQCTLQMDPWGPTLIRTIMAGWLTWHARLNCWQSHHVQRGGRLMHVLPCSLHDP